jgi:fumarate reductase subunit D
MPPATVEPVVVDVVAILAPLGLCSLFSLSQTKLLQLSRDIVNP